MHYDRKNEKYSGSCDWIELNHLNILFVMSLSTYKASGIWERSMSFHHFVSRQASNCKIHKQSLWNMYYKCIKISNHLQTFMHNQVLWLFENIWEKKLTYYDNNKHAESIAYAIYTGICPLHVSLCTGIVNDLVFNIYVPNVYA